MSTEPAAACHDGDARPGNGTTQLMAERPQVYFDGGCPVCSREIAFYRARPGADGLVWVDVNASDPQALGPGLTPQAAMARIHVRRPDGTLVSGAAAFGVMWRELPGFRWLGRLLGVPPFGALAEWLYRGFLATRRVWR